MVEEGARRGRADRPGDGEVEPPEPADVAMAIARIVVHALGSGLVVVLRVLVETLFDTDFVHDVFRAARLNS